MQVSDFLQRVKGRRFPTIEKDMQMVLSHCGPLLLDQAALCQVLFCLHGRVGPIQKLSSDEEQLWAIQSQAISMCISKLSAIGKGESGAQMPIDHCIPECLVQFFVSKTS